MSSEPLLFLTREQRRREKKIEKIEEPGASREQRLALQRDKERGDQGARESDGRNSRDITFHQTQKRERRTGLAEQRRRESERIRVCAQVCVTKGQLRVDVLNVHHDSYIILSLNLNSFKGLFPHTKQKFQTKRKSMNSLDTPAAAAEQTSEHPRIQSSRT